MKKNVILLFIFTFTIVLTLSSFKVSASSYNVNLASPDLTDKEYLGNGVYRLYSNIGLTFDYDVYSGDIIVNGTSTSANAGVIFKLATPLLNGETVTISRIADLTKYRFSIYLSPNLQAFIGGYNLTNTIVLNSNKNQVIFADIGIGNVYNNYRFKLQIEKGSTATPYKIPMNALRQHQELISGDLPNNFFQVLFDLMKDFIRSIAFVWVWLNAPIKIGFELPIIGYIGIPPFTPLSAFGIGILVVIGLWAVKSLVPMG